jgi:hypothetical protein
LYLAGTWDRFFYERFARDTDFKDLNAVPGNFFLLSLFDRVPPPSFEQGDRYRWDMHRAALRQLDVSGAVSAGQLVILAESDANTPLPVPIEVEGELVTGEGITYYQFILPLDRSALLAPTTKPSTRSVGVNERLKLDNSASGLAALSSTFNPPSSLSKRAP